MLFAALASAVIAVAPVGDTPDAEIAALVPVLAATFGRAVVIAPRVALPAAALDPARRQHRAEIVNDALAAARRPGWQRLLGVADVDLFVPSLNFVFGLADSERGVAVFSLARLHAADTARRRRRAAVEAVHELGHTYGLAHCDDPRCVMFFSNRLEDTDRKGPGFCARHAAELERALGRR